MTELASKTEALPCCRFCGTKLNHVFADLGSTPLANRNITAAEVSSERSYPLIARICNSCLLVQVDDSVPPDQIFSDYDYFSSFSSDWLDHSRRYSEAMISRFGLNQGSRVVEIASNDGYLLQYFKARGIAVQGVDPARNVAAVAIAKEIPTEIAFFGVDTARRMLANDLSADLIAANNVLAHVPDLRDFVGGFELLLKPEGVATFEFPHVLQLIDNVQFDTIYHEHFYYLSLVAVEKVLAAARLRAFDVEELATHGGSLRLFVCKEGASFKETAALQSLRHKETARRLDSVDEYTSFASRISATKTSFLEFLQRARQSGKKVAGYGAAAKGNTFLNFCGVGRADISRIYDLNPAKQGKLTPGSHVPIRSPADISVDRPDFLVILPWNISSEIMRSMAAIDEWGGRFVLAVPETRVV